MVNTAKGKYFEYLVTDELNAHHAVGDVILPSGYHAELADSMIQPGWDIRIVDGHGQVADFLQLKATESVGYIKHALDVYPDIVILTTDEVAKSLDGNSMILDSHISESDLANTIHATFDATNPGFLDEFWHSFHPLFPLLVIAAAQSYKVAVGKQRVVEAADEAKRRASRSMVTTSVGTLAKLLSHSVVVAIPVGMMAGWLFDRSGNIKQMTERVRNLSTLWQSRARFYQSRTAVTY